MTTCTRCGAELSDWELQDGALLGVTPCWCAGLPRGVNKSPANLAYQVLCDPALARPVKIHDVVRFVASRYARNPNSMNVTLSQNKRFCWAGRGLYGLARHR